MSCFCRDEFRYWNPFVNCFFCWLAPLQASYDGAFSISMRLCTEERLLCLGALGSWEASRSFDNILNLFCELLGFESGASGVRRGTLGWNAFFLNSGGG